ncbi:DNA methyltransferase, partial [Streptomyces brasiliscabiei]|uniref:DNA methyltransferase n=1 Tax=Streptomyces brasiliscabiei TaxID=2736302 RepID=UPI0038F662C3
MQYIAGTLIEVAFVSTNSICQGQQAVTLWKPLFATGIQINYAYKTFIWNSEAKEKAHVHCIIVSFSYKTRKKKILFDESGQPTVVKYINSYLMNRENIFIESRSEP